MSSAPPPPSQIIIIGAGVFGLATALALLERPPYAHSHITVLDSSPTLPNPSGSSVDSSRIVRADYASAPYAKLAVAAQQLWRDAADDGWGGRGRYREPGFVLTADRGADEYVMKSLQNVRALAASGLVDGLDLSQVEELPDPDAIRRASGHPGASGDFGYVNWSSGWADAEACVAYALERVRTQGRHRLAVRSGCTVRKLLFKSPSPGCEAMSACVGVELESDETISADLVVLAAGAWSPTLIDLRGRVVATGQAIAYIEISEDEQRMLEKRPTVMNMSRGMFLIPPRGQELKVARHAFGYHNLEKVYIKGTVHGEEADIEQDQVSVPAAISSIPPDAEVDCRDFLRDIIPEMADRPFVRTRICWYCDTPDGDYLIDWHPEYENLFVATGGSGHGFKFFPVIGDKILDAIERRLDPELKRLWQWRDASTEVFFGTADGSRSGRKGMLLSDELERSHR